MNKEKVKGTIDEAAGRARRQGSEWTGDTKGQVKGAVQEVKGKIEKGVGHAKDAMHDAQIEHEKQRERELEHEHEKIRSGGM